MKKLKQPTRLGGLSGATHRSEVVNPVCGDALTLHLRIESGLIAKAGFEASGCPPTIAVGSFLAERCEGHDLQWCQTLTIEEILQDWLGGVPPGKEHVGHLALSALRLAWDSPVSADQ